MQKMKLIFDKQSYTYSDSSAGHHHAYLLSPLFSLLKVKDLISTKVKVLDIGCGNGSLSNVIARQGYDVTGVEESASGLTNAKKSYSNCNFLQASVYNLPYSELGSKFDVVVSVEVVEHLLYPRELLKVAKQCLKPDGLPIISTPYHGYLKNLALSLVGKMDSHYTALWDGGHIKFFSVNTFSQLLAEEDFKDIKFQYTGRLPYLWKSMLCSSSLS